VVEKLMARRWLYETLTGNNICVGQTSDDTRTEVPENDGSPEFEPVAWSADDPIAPNGFDLVPTKRYIVATNTVIEATAGDAFPRRLRLAKRLKNRAIDIKTEFLFRKGLVFESETFPFALDDFVNYMSYYDNRNSITTPFLIAQRNLDSFSLNNANHIRDFGDAAIARRDSIVNGAQALKKQLFDATTLAQVQAVTDSRA
jgi:hypothetical protein